MECRFNSTRRDGELTARGAARSVARGATRSDGDDQMVSETAGQEGGHVDHYVGQRFDGGRRGAFPVTAGTIRSVGNGEENEEAAWTTADE